MIEYDEQARRLKLRERSRSAVPAPVPAAAAVEPSADDGLAPATP
ncbi:hypothetical protein [Xanthomonas fragariae]|nr:hypothetical protein [Xanthomonas fragariae]